MAFFFHTIICACVVVVTQASNLQPVGSLLDDPPKLLPNLEGTWTDSGTSQEFRMIEYQPTNVPAVPKNTIYSRSCVDCLDCRLNPQYDYDTLNVTSFNLDCSDGIERVFDGRHRVAGADGNSSEWRRDPTSIKAIKRLKNANIHTVHMVYMNHYDVGYTESINTVDNEYMHNYFPLAADTAAEMRNSSNDSFIYTTHPWLMHRYLSCPCPTPVTPPNAIQGVWTDLTGLSRFHISKTTGENIFSARCLTTNWKGGGAGGCGWKQSNCTLTDAIMTCKSDSGGTFSGAVNGATIDFASPWSKFTGALSGLWYGPSDTQDYYIITHNVTDGAATVWWDVSITAHMWTYGFGNVTGSTITLMIPSYNPATPLVGAINSANTSIAWVGSAGSWNEHEQQCYPLDECAGDAACLARSLNNPYAAPLRCPSMDEVDQFTVAAKRGDIVWHAGPFNWQPENMSPQLFDAGIDIVRSMDDRFYGTSKNTTTMSVRDVIYVTRSVIPFLKKRGITGLTIGSNGADFPPQVPKLHRWLDEESQTDVIVAYHPYGYGGYGIQDCAESPNGFALCTEFRTDNTGPPKNADEVTQSLDKVRAEYPSAVVKTSTFDNFIADVMPAKDQLPTVTMEVGDSWMYGTPSDPLKMAQNRAIQRVWIECLQSGNPACATSDPTINNMTWALLKAPEHTWGTPGLEGGNVYNVTTFRSGLNASALQYLHASASWAEQRIYNELAVKALEEAGHPIAKQVRLALDELVNIVTPDVSEYVEATSNTFTTTTGTVITIGSDGSIIQLKDGNNDWASTESTLAAFVYQTFNETEWKPFTYSYINGHGESGGFCKVGSNSFSESAFWTPTVTKLYVRGTQTSASSIVAHCTMPTKSSTVYGAPAEFFLNLTFSRGSASELDVAVVLTTLDKLPTMVGEASMITFKPAPVLIPKGNDSAWGIDKMGGHIDPENVINGGNQFNHASWGGVTVNTVAGQMSIESLDAVNMCPMTPTFPNGNPLPASYNKAQAMSGNGMQTLAKGTVQGMAVNLHNNLWNTNYPLFYPYYDPVYCTTPLTCKNANAMFRFKMSFSSPTHA